MSEWSVGWLATLKLLLVTAFATAYWMGGRHWKPMRRFIGGGILAGGTLAFSLLQGTFHWWFLVSLLAFPAALSLGYGAETLSGKLKGRARYGLWLGVAGACFFSMGWPWTLWAFQTGLAIFASVLLGTLNPAPAAEEETLIALLSVVCVPFYV